MFKVKIVIADPKTGKCYQKEIEDDSFLGLKIGNKIKGDSFEMAGYEFEITGGSDRCGFPMRYDVNSSGRKRVLIVSGVGAKGKNKGQRQKKTVVGNTIGTHIHQINIKILKYGKAKLGEVPVEEKPATEVKAEEKVEENKVEVKEEKKGEEVKEEKKGEEVKEEKKEEPKVEEKPE